MLSKKICPPPLSRNRREISRYWQVPAHFCLVFSEQWYEALLKSKALCLSWSRLTGCIGPFAQLKLISHILISNEEEGKQVTVVNCSPTCWACVRYYHPPTPKELFSMKTSFFITFLSPQHCWQLGNEGHDLVCTLPTRSMTWEKDFCSKLKAVFKT